MVTDLIGSQVNCVHMTQLVIHPFAELIQVDALSRLPGKCLVPLPLLSTSLAITSFTRQVSSASSSA